MHISLTVIVVADLFLTVLRRRHPAAVSCLIDLIPGGTAMTSDTGTGRVMGPVIVNGLELQRKMTDPMGGTASQLHYCNELIYRLFPVLISEKMSPVC